ncbi:MAG: hypothetical protein ABL921_02000 [Pirellula sp.]|jgi:uncharacterized protein (DUF4415 family)
MTAKIGDKVRHKAANERGIVVSVNGDKLSVRLQRGEVLALVAKDVTNFSLAARKAWQNMPVRSVGRPAGTTKTDRVSVTLRIDRDLWERFKAAEASGQISDRTTVINEWIGSKLSKLASSVVSPPERS